MADIVVSVASKVAEYLVAPVGRQCGYVIFTDSYVGELKEELEKLDDVRFGVQHSVDDAQKTNMREIKREVNRWMNKAEIVANRAQGMLDNDVTAKKTCFYGWLPNPKERYRLGRDARKTVQAIESLILQGKFESVAYESAPPGQVAGAPDVNSSVSDGGDTITDSRASIFQGIMKALDDEKLKVIGVYGPGGVGKTTLLEEVEKKLRKEGRPFHMIIKAKVSQNYVLKNIQDEIAYYLKLDLKDMQSEGVRGKRLLERLRTDPSEKVLIILDDLWEELDLKGVGIPSGDVSGKCKLLLTSRFRDVLEQKMGADQTFLLEGLNNVEAFRLFENNVGDRLKDDAELKAIAAQVVKKLAGLPLLIISVATALKYRRVFAWKNALKKIDTGKMETIVKLSYDHLETDNTRSLFLLCGLISGTIEVELLLGLGMGLGLFEGFNDTIEKSRDILNDMLDELRSVCLLQDGGVGKENVTIHDLYSEVVISNAFSGQPSLMINSNYGSWPKEKLEKCWACLVNFGSDRLVELMPCRFPHVKILTLSEQHDMGDCSRMDFTYMKELRVLCLRSMDMTSLPSSMEILGNLQSLSIDCNVEDVAILGKLEALRILNFAGSEISRLPKEIGELTNLQSLNLSNCYFLEIIDPGALKGLINLEELHMKENFDKWIGEHEIPSESCGVGLAELKSLTKLTSLEISIPRPIILLEDGDLPFGNLVRFWIRIGTGQVSKFKGLKTMQLNLEGCDNILSREWVQKALEKTQYLNLCKLSEFKRSAHELCTQGFRELKHLHIDGGPSIKYIANSSDAFMKLESLFLENLINLEKIYHGPIAPECFSKLKAVSVKRCGRLKYLWHLSDMQRFVQLEEIEVWRCDSMQSIVKHDSDNRIELPNVCRLVLGELPNMTSFCVRAEITSEDIPIEVPFPRLESLVMVGLLDQEKILYNQPPLEYNNLKSLEIRESKSTSKSVLKSDWILKMPNLESLKIKSSQSTEVAFDLEELKVTGHVEILSRLMELTIWKLPNLRCMWKQDVKLRGISVFQSLKKLEVSNTGLAFLFPMSVARCLREIRDIEVKNCPNMKAVIVDEEGRDKGTDDVIEFPLLERLLIHDCPMEKFLSYPRGNKEPVTATSDSQDAYSDSFFDQKGDCTTRKKSKFQTLPLESLESLFDRGSLVSNTERKIVSLPKMEKVEVSGARRLGHMVKSDSHMVLGFPSLIKVKVENCSELRYLFPNYTATTLGKLEGLWISECERMNEVVYKEEGGQSKAEVMSFPSLDYLCILQCHNFGVFIRSPASVDRPLGETAEVDDESPQAFFNEMICSISYNDHLYFYIIRSNTLSCFRKNNVILCPTILLSHIIPVQARFPNIRSLDIKGAQCRKLWNNQIPIDSFCKLKSLKLEHCDNLQRIAPSCIWKRLQGYLETLTVDSCQSIEIIFESDVYAEKGGNPKRLILSDLDKLRHIWQYDGLLEGGEIRDIDVWDCPNMKAVIADEEGRGEGIDDIIEFPLLERISISRCPTDKFFSYRHGKKRSVTSTSDSQDAYSDSFFDPKVSLPSLKTLDFYKVGSFQRIWHGDLPKSSFCELATLSLDCCSDLLNVFPFTIIGRLHKLEDIDIANCPSLESLFDFGSLDAKTEQTTVLLPKLEVSVGEAGKMRCLVMSESQTNLGFPSLEDVQVDNCSDMKYLFPHFTATTLEKLESINISRCEHMKEVVLVQEGGRSKEEVMRFPSLEYLSISQCRNFGAFIQSPTSVKRQLDEMAKKNDESPQPLFNEMVTFPNIRSLNIEDVKCKELWNNQIPIDSFCKLECLELKKCDNLRRIASSHMWKRLQRCLEILQVISCRSIEIIYEGDGADTESGKLRRLVLRDLENLRHIWSDGLPNVPFPNLRDVEAMRCSHLEMLFATFTAKFLGHIEELVVESCEDMELIAGHEKWEEANVTTITFSKLTVLRLFELPKFRSFLPEKYSLKFPYSEDFPFLRVLSVVSCGAEPDQGNGDWESHRRQRRERWLWETSGKMGRCRFGT